jgi:hypothetical protein
MLLKIEGDIFDCQFGLMEDLLLTIEKKLSLINHSIQKSSDPESDGLLDHGEYLIGAGFVLLQQQLHTSLTFINTPPKKAFKIGPLYAEDLYIAEVINNCANYWKHEPEWVGNKYNQFSNYQKNTRDEIAHYKAIALETLLQPTNSNLEDVNTEHNEDGLYLFIESYPLSQIICETTENNECSFLGLLQHVKDWQKAVFENCEHYSTLGK